MMHEADPRGYLVVGNRHLTMRDIGPIARLSAIDAADVKILLKELQDAGVFSIAEDGTIFSRRMVRDAKKEQKDKENGQSGGNPNLKPKKNPEHNQDDNDRENHDDNQTDNSGDKSEDNDGVNPPVKGEDKAQKPETRDQKSETKNQNTPPTPHGGVGQGEEQQQRVPRPLTEPFGLADWFFGEAYALELLGFHEPGARDEWVKRELGAAKDLLANGVAECQARARRYLLALKSGELTKSAPTVRGLKKAWDYGCVRQPSLRLAIGGGNERRNIYANIKTIPTELRK